MSVVPRSVVAMAHVKSVPRSIEFYERLGFRVRNTFVPDGAAEPAWASLESGAARLMLTLADEPVAPDRQAVLFYLYYDDAEAAHAELRAAGLDVGELTYPFYCPRGEFRLVDPDGYVLMLTHT